MGVRRFVAVTMFLLVPAMVSAQVAVSETISGTSLSISSDIAYETAILQISGPGSYYLNQRFEAGAPVAVDLVTDGRIAIPGAPTEEEVAVSTLPDGLYRYDLSLSKLGEQFQQISGRFFVEGGGAVSRREKQAELNAVRGELNRAAAATETNSAAEAFENDYIYIFDSSNDGLSWLTFDSDNSSGTTLELWGLANNAGDFSIQECGSSTPSGVCQLTTFFAPDDSSGQVGFGTTAVASTTQMHVRGATSGLMVLEEADTSSQFWVGPWNGRFLIDSIGGAGRVIIDDSTGNMVVGSGSPDELLTVSSADPQILVQSSSGTTTGRTLAYLKNKGDVRMFWENTGSGDIWQMSLLATVLQMSTPTGDGKFRVRKNGGLQALRGSTTILDLDSTGDLTVKSVTQTSSREEKRGFEAVDGLSVLDKVAALPISEWSYKADNPSVRHLGPMAEDFHAAFGLGRSDKGLTSVDTSGVALAAIQGLVEENRRLEERISELEEMVQALAED